MKKCYAYNQSDDYIEIVFAKNKKEARNQFDETPILEDIYRIPEFDQYWESGNVPDKVLYESGWWLECSHCYEKYSQDYGEESPVFVENNGFCCEDCKHEYYKRIDDLNKSKEESIKYLVENYPGIEIKNVLGFRSAHVYFDYPGRTTALLGEYRAETNSIYVANGDIENWNNYVSVLNK
jgi:hypothetical protein